MLVDPPPPPPPPPPRSSADHGAASFLYPLVSSFVQAYRVACHYGDSEEQVEESMRIASSAVYNKLMLFVLVSKGGGQVVQSSAGYTKL